MCVLNITFFLNIDGTIDITNNIKIHYYVLIAIVLLIVHIHVNSASEISIRIVLFMSQLCINNRITC